MASLCHILFIWLCLIDYLCVLGEYNVMFWSLYSLSEDSIKLITITSPAYGNFFWKFWIDSAMFSIHSNTLLDEKHKEDYSHFIVKKKWRY